MVKLSKLSKIQKLKNSFGAFLAISRHSNCTKSTIPRLMDLKIRNLNARKRIHLFVEMYHKIR